ncbi:MAG: PQQ-binding-like beta-propeller repeat protein [Myxococcota bacterium]
MPWLVAPSVGTSSTTCAARHALFDTLRQGAKEPVEWAKNAASADAELSNHRWTVTLDGTQKTGATLNEALEAAWPSRRSPLSSVTPPSLRSLLLACDGRIEAAYAVAGAAIPMALARIGPPESDRSSHDSAILMHHWASVRAREASGTSKTALSALRGVARRLSRGELAPTWRQPPRPGWSPELSAMNDAIIAFDDGIFEAYDLESGRRRWRRQVGTAEPIPVALPQGAKVERILIVLAHAVEVLDLATGRRIWRTRLRAPRAEIAVLKDLVFVATAETIIALDRNTGQERWRFDGLSTPVAGPVLSNDNLVVPLANRIVLLNPDTGHQLRALPLHDELSAPLAVSPKGAIWALVGSDEVAHVAPELTKVSTHIRTLPGITWPPVLSGEALLMNVGPHSDRGHLMYVAPGQSRARRLAKAIRSPIGQIDPETAVYVDRRRTFAVRRGRRRPNWKKRVKRPFTAWSADSDHIAVAITPTVHIWRSQDGRETHRIQLDGPVETIIYGARGGTALMKDGGLYGLPEPNAPLMRSLRQEVYLTLAEAYRTARRPAASRRAAKLAVTGASQDAVALVKVAEADSQLGRSTEIESWLAVLPRASMADRERAFDALYRSAGVEAAMNIGASAIMSTDDWLLVQTESGVEARPAGNARFVRWTAPGVRLSQISAHAVKLNDRWHGVSDGRPLADPHREPVREGLYIDRRQTPALIVRTLRGKKSWSQALENGSQVMESTDSHFIVYGEHSIALWSLATGDIVWRRPHRTRPLKIWSHRDRIIIHSPSRIGVVKTSDGRQLYRLKVGKEAPIIVGRRSIVYADGRSLQFVDAHRGRSRGRLKLASRPHKLWRTGQHIFAALENGQLIAVDSQRRKRLGRILLPADDGVVSRNRLCIVDKAGRLIVLDADQLRARLKR